MKKQIPKPSTQINVLRRYLHILALLQNDKDPRDWNASSLAALISAEEEHDPGVADKTIRDYIEDHLKHELGIKFVKSQGMRRIELAEPLDDGLLQRVANIYSTFVITDSTREVIISTLLKKHHHDALWMLARIHFAIITRNTIRFDYMPHGQKERYSYNVNPYHLVFRNNNLYLIGHNHYRHETSLFILNKIDNLKVLDSKFTEPIPALAEIFKDSIGSYIGKKHTVTIRYTHKVYSRMEQLFSGIEADIKVLKEDELYEASFTVSDITYLCSQLFMYGREVKIIRPKSLRGKMTAMLRESLEVYEG
jgi:hypothetical protein